MARGDSPRVLDSRMLLVSVHRGQRLLGHVICSGEVLKGSPFVASNNVRARVIVSWHYAPKQIRHLTWLVRKVVRGHKTRP